MIKKCKRGRREMFCKSLRPLFRHPDFIEILEKFMIILLYYLPTSVILLL